MQLISETVPKGYEEYVNLLSNSVSYKYKSEHEKRFKYFFVSFTDLINDIITSNKKYNFLLKEEKDFLEYAHDIFKKGKNQAIKFEEYYKLLSKAFKSLEKRIDLIKVNLLDLIKKHDLQTSKIDNKYLFIIENIQKQLLEVREIITQNKFPKLNEQKKSQVLKTIRIVIENYGKIVITIASKDFGSVEDIYSSTMDIWSDDFLKLNIDNKIAA